MSPTARRPDGVRRRARAAEVVRAVAAPAHAARDLAARARRRRPRERESLGRAAREGQVRRDQPGGRRAAGSATTWARRARSPTSRGCRRSRAQRCRGWDVDPHRVYAYGGSMGGQETLLLLARHPHLLAGAAASTPSRTWPGSTEHSRRCPAPGVPARPRRAARPATPGLARSERAAPAATPRAFAERSPVACARAIAASCVPLQIWWSLADRVVVDQPRQSGKRCWNLRARTRAPRSAGTSATGCTRTRCGRATRLPFALASSGCCRRAPSRVTTGCTSCPRRPMAASASRRRRRGRCAGRST